MKRLAIGVALALVTAGCTVTLEFEPLPAATPVAIRPLSEATKAVWSGGLAAGEGRNFSFSGAPRAGLRACLQSAASTPARLEAFDSQLRRVFGVDEAAATAQAIFPVPTGLCATFTSDSTGRGYLRATNRGLTGDHFSLFLHHR